MSNNRSVSMSVIVAVVTFSLGCASDSIAPPEELEPTVEFADEYLIGIGDTIQVTVWRHNDLSIAAPVRPDGKITVPIAGDIDVGGRTPESVADSISDALQEIIREPIVTVSVTNMGSADYLTRVRVTGAVQASASLPYRQGMTVLDLVLDAGGPNEFANLSRTTLYRANGEKLRVRLDRIMNRGDLSTNYAIRPGDVVTIPERVF